MEQTADKEFVERVSPIDNIESTHYELVRARQYSGIESDGEYTYSTVRLEIMGHKWLQEEDNELRSPRSRAEARKISNLIAFELAYRNGELDKLEELLS